MEKHYFIVLLHKYLSGEASPVEVQFLERYYNLFQDEPDVLSLLSGEQKKALKGQIHKEIWSNIGAMDQPRFKLRKLNILMIGISAAAILLVLFSVRLFFFPGVQVKEKSVAILASINNENHVITLPDGSMVMLDSGSKLNYPASFDGLGKREVYLDGQAYFDIKHMASSPFVVHAGKVNVMVLGTTFNVKAFPRETEITITVKKGKVQVNDQSKTLGTIIPREQIVYNKENEHSIQKTVNTDEYMNWKEQDLLFDNLTVSEAASLLEDRFGVKIFIRDNAVRSERFTATFPKTESLDQALKSICEFNGAVYRYDKEKATVMISDK
jgi:ferric-dicitrate binding protein FerR (iron transport regulator)